MNRDKIFNRREYLEIIEKRVNGLKHGYRQNLAIIGDELTGKTSLVFNFLDNLHDNYIIPLYLEVRPESQEEFARRFIGVLLYNFLLNSGVPLLEDLPFLIKKAQRFIPRTTEKIKYILSLSGGKKKKINLITELFGLCDLVYAESGKSCAIILDEFHNLETMNIRELYREWSKQLILQKHTMYIIISSQKFRSRVILSKDLSLLFGNFEVINVEPFDIKTSNAYLNQKLGSATLETGFKNFLIHFTGGLPFYLDVLTDEILKLSPQRLAQIIEDQLFDSCGALNQRFSNYLKRFLDSPHSSEYVSLLYLIACGRNKIKDIAQMLHKPQKETALRAKALLELDAISKNGDFLKVNDRVFAFWLRFVYQEKMRSLTFDAKNQKDYFRGQVEGLIQEFLSYARRPIGERVTELARLFEDETVHIEKKRLRLAHFREIKPLEFNRCNLKDGLICRCQDSLWIMAFKPEQLTEEDVAEFAKECRKYRHKQQRKIIVGFQEIETNARLRAMEENILTWDLNNLNQILDLFSKPRIIL
jgi:hypothetical protein